MDFSFLKRKSDLSGRINPEDILLRKKNADPLYQEKFKALRAKFEYKIDRMNVKIVAVTSAIAGEGKTTTCGNLAIDLAATGRKRVLLIDLDLRKSDLARSFNISGHSGMSEYLRGSASSQEIVRNSVVPGLSIIPAGGVTQTPGDLLNGERFRAFLKGVRDQFDVVLLDTPPILPVADTLSLRDQVDRFLFIMRVGFTPYKMFAEAVGEVGEKNLIGVVLNGVEPKSEKYYERYYGAYYRKITEKEPVA